MVSASGTREQEPAVSSEVPEFSSVAAKVVGGVKRVIPRVVLTGAALGAAACGSRPVDLPPAPTPIIEPIAPDLRPTLSAGEKTVIPALPTASRTIVPSETATTTATAASSTATATETPTATWTATASPTRTETATPTGTASKTATASRTPTATASATETARPSVTATDTKRPDTATPVPAETSTPAPSATQEVQPGGGEIYESKEHGTRIEIQNDDPRLRVFPQKKNLDELLALIKEFGKKKIVIYVKSFFDGVDNDENGNFVDRGQTICGSQSRGCIYHRRAYDSTTGELKIFMYVSRGLETIVYFSPKNQQINTVNDTLVGQIINPGNPGRERAEKFYFSGPDGWLFNTQLTSP